MFGDDAGGVLASPTTKFGYATRAVPVEKMIEIVPLPEEPQVGDLVLVRVKRLGRHKRVEARGGYNLDLFEGDYLVGSYGNRYATDQYEGYIPQGPVAECDILSVGAVLGEVSTRHAAMATPTRVEVIGAVADSDGNTLNQRDYGLMDSGFAEAEGSGEPEVILVVGSSMNSGKTTTVGVVARSLSRAGYRVAAAKVTGTAAGKDVRHFAASGAHPVLDFISAGYPSTYMISEWELTKVYSSIVENLKRSNPDYIVLEIADGIFQRETRMLLESDLVRDGVDHVLFAAGDALSVSLGSRFVRELGLPLRATSGAITASDLGVREAEELSDLPCLDKDRILSEDFPGILSDEPRACSLERIA